MFGGQFNLVNTDNMFVVVILTVTVQLALTRRFSLFAFSEVSFFVIQIIEITSYDLDYKDSSGDIIKAQSL